MNGLQRKSYTLHILTIILLCIIATFLLYFETFVIYQDSLMEYLTEQPVAYVHMNVNHVRGSRAAFVFDAIPESAHQAFSEFAIVYPKNLTDCPLFIMDAKKGVELAGMPTKLIKSGIRPIVAFSCNPELLEYVSPESSNQFSFDRKERSFFSNSMVQATIAHDISIPENNEYQLITLLESATKHLISTKNTLFKIEKPAKDSIVLSITTDPSSNPTKSSKQNRHFAVGGLSLTHGFTQHRSLINSISTSVKNTINQEIKALEQQHAIDAEFRDYISSTLNGPGYIHILPKNEAIQTANQTLFEKYDIHIVVPKEKKEIIELLLENIARRLEPSESRTQLEDRTPATELIPSDTSPLLQNIVEIHEIPVNHYYTENGLFDVYSLEYQETIVFSTMNGYLDNTELSLDYNQTIWDASLFELFSSFESVTVQSTDKRIDLRIQ